MRYISAMKNELKAIYRSLVERPHTHEVLVTYRGKTTREFAKSQHQAQILASEAVFGRNAKVTIKKIKR